MFDSATTILAMAAPAEGQGQAGGIQSFIATMMPMILIFVIMYFLLVRPQQKKAREHQELLNQLKAGDRIITGGGLLGTVMAVKEKTFQVKIAENVVVDLARGSVATVIGKEDYDLK